MPNYTLVLTEETAQRVRDLVKSFGGSIGGFGASLVSDLSHLSPDKVHAVRQQIAVLAREAQDAKKAGEGSGAPKPGKLIR